MTRYPKWNELDMQSALTCSTSPFDYRTCAVVPNVSYGLRTVIGDRREVDLLALKGSKTGNHFHAVEIKVNRLDLLRDKRKECNRFGVPMPAVRYRWYAVPAHLVGDVLAEVDASYGVLSAVRGWYCEYVETIREPTAWYVRDPTPAEVLKFYRLGLWRYWTGVHK